MKKTLLLSVVASTMIMAGGDIAPVEPAVVSGWDFSGQAVAYYQTSDVWGDADLFSTDNATGNLGLQLRAVNKDVAYGIGAGFELTGLTEFPFATENFNQKPGSENDSAGWMSQAYLTYGFGNTSLKIGRQELPKALSPFAFSEGWNVFKNTFDAALIVNTDLTDTTLVYAFVQGANSITSDMNEFNEINDDGVHMLTAQNKSVEGLTLTGTWYTAPDMGNAIEIGHHNYASGDINVLWADAKFALSGVNIALQGGTVKTDDEDLDDTSAYGAKLGYGFGVIDASLAYSSVDDGSVPIHNLGTGVKTPLYTQMVGNQNWIKSDSNTFVLRAGMKALNGKFGVAYGVSDIGDGIFKKYAGQNGWREITGHTYQELDLTYKVKATENITLFAAYVMQNDKFTDIHVNGQGVPTGNASLEDFDIDNDMIRLWARYNF